MSACSGAVGVFPAGHTCNSLDSQFTVDEPRPFVLPDTSALGDNLSCTQPWLLRLAVVRHSVSAATAGRRPGLARLALSRQWQHRKCTTWGAQLPAHAPEPCSSALQGIWMKLDMLQRMSTPPAPAGGLGRPAACCAVRWPGQAAALAADSVRLSPRLRHRPVAAAVSTNDRSDVSRTGIPQPGHEPVGPDNAGAAAVPGGKGEQLDDKERERRRKISEANLGRTPWNKGRKHSPGKQARRRGKSRRGESACACRAITCKTA
eukprot:366336-Chlamydomonas_euryale.AAC.29